MRKLAFVAIAAVALAATAATPIHRVPGQWEITTSMQFTKGGIQIPPDVQAMMKQRGIKLPDMTAPHTFKQCLTPEEAAKDEHPDFSQDKSCRSVNSKWSGNHFHAEFTCDNNGHAMHSNVDGTMTSGGKAYSGTLRMEGDNPQMGGHFVMEGKSSGKWLGPTCSKVAQ